MKHFLSTTTLVVALLMASPVQADGGLLTSETVDPQATSPELSTLSIAERIELMTELVKQLSYVAALQAGVPEVEHDDEGFITVVVNETMIAPCAGQDSLNGEQCVRHQGNMGLSTIDLAKVTNFVYDDRFSYDLTLIRTRSNAYGETGEPQYEYMLVRIGRLAFAG